MVQGLAFLSKKNFNPQNNTNRKAVWEAEQQKKQERKRALERQEQLKREKDDEELARARDGSRGGNQAALRFMYSAPPGLPPSSGEKTTEEEYGEKPSSASSQDVTQRQPGDDDAAAAFRAMFAKPISSGTGGEGEGNDTENCATDVASSHQVDGVLVGSTIEASRKGNENLSALEKAVGRKDASSSLTLEEYVARFPQLKNAPMAKGMSSTNVGVNFKPLGAQIRNVRCLACGIWGHSRGDRECELSGWNPFSGSSSKPSETAPSSSIMGPTRKSHSSEEAELSENPISSRRKERKRDYSSSSSGSDSDSEDSYRRRKRRSRKHKSSSRHRRKESKRRRRSRSASPDDRKSRKSHKKNRKKYSTR